MKQKRHKIDEGRRFEKFWDSNGAVSDSKQGNNIITSVGDNAKCKCGGKFEHDKLTDKNIKNGYTNDTLGIVTGKYPELANRIRAIRNLYLCLT